VSTERVLRCPKGHLMTATSPGYGFCAVCGHSFKGAPLDAPRCPKGHVAEHVDLDGKPGLHCEVCGLVYGNGHANKAQDAAELAAERTTPYRTSWTCADLLDADLPAPRWVIPELLPVGLAILGGRPKSGKSFMALQLAVAVASGGRFLDVDIDAGRVLYVALEDSPRRLQERLKDMHATRGLPLAFELDYASLADADGVNALHNRIAADRVSLTIIDTLTRACPGVKWKDVEAVTPVAASLQKLAMATDTTVLLIDHTRKPGALEADPIDDLMGSTGKSAVIDTALVLYKVRGEPSATLRAVGRDIEESELALTFRSDVGWTLKGDARDVAQSEAEESVLAAVETLGEADAGAIARDLGKTRPAVIPILQRLEARGLIASTTTKSQTGSVKIVYSPV